MEQILNWIEQNQTSAIVMAVIGVIIFTLSLKRTITKISASNGGVVVNGDSHGTIMTGDINSNRSGLLGALANIATILGLLVGTATLYISYLALIKE